MNLIVPMCPARDMRAPILGGPVVIVAVFRGYFYGERCRVIHIGVGRPVGLPALRSRGAVAIAFRALPLPSETSPDRQSGKTCSDAGQDVADAYTPNVGISSYTKNVANCSSYDVHVVADLRGSVFSSDRKNSVSRPDYTSYRHQCCSNLMARFAPIS
jgi:hypothetical protein